MPDPKRPGEYKVGHWHCSLVRDTRENNAFDAAPVFEAGAPKFSRSYVNTIEFSKSGLPAADGYWNPEYVMEI